MKKPKSPSKPKQRKHSYHHGNLRDALIKAGIDILETEGLSALTLRAIAARAGVSHTAPKNHFSSLRDLLTAIATEGFRKHAAFMRAGMTATSPPQHRLQAAMEGYVRFAAENKALFLLMFSDQHCDFTNPELKNAASQSYAVLADIATGLDWDKADLPGSQQRTEMMLWSFAHGYALLYNTGQFAVTTAKSATIRKQFEIAGVMPAFKYRQPT
jgi:AcrR family transcriptional regulator